MPLSHDLRAGVRRLRQNPGFSLIAVLTLALGIGANASIFSVINSILFRPLPVERGSELVSLNRTLTGLAGYSILPASVGRKGSSQRMWGYMVTGNYFDLLGIKPLAGRLLQPEDDQVRG